MTLEAATEASIMLLIQPAPNSPDVTDYISTIISNSTSSNFSSCSVPAKQSDMQCEITGLELDTEYHVYVTACIALNGTYVCGDGVEIYVKTILIGEFKIFTKINSMIRHKLNGSSDA